MGKWIDKFCRKHPDFGIPNLMTVLVAGTAVVFLLDQFSGYTASMLVFFHRGAILQGQVWRLITFVFQPVGSNILTVALSLYFYWWIGSSLEQEWGTARFSSFYLLGVVFNIIFGLIAGTTSVTYLNLSMLFAFAALYPEMRVLLFFFIPIKIKWLAWADALLFALGCISSLLRLDFVGAVLPLVSILNFFLFFWDDFVEAFAYRRRRFQHQHSAQTVNFKKAVKNAYQQKGYLHKCAVCGKTDTDYPDMEFRYCSKCEGYYCYCMEHINDHTHIQA